MPTLPLDERLDRFVHQRAHLLEAVTPFRRAAACTGRSPRRSARAMRAGSAFLRAEVEQVFAAELSRVPASVRAEVADALATASSWASWETLRTEWDDDPDRARAVLARLVRAVLVHTST